MYLFTLKPIIYGFIGMIISGASFPLCGVIVLRHSLVPLRYMLMHGVILGGILSLALHIPLLPVSVVINLILIAFILILNREKNGGLSAAGSAMMVFTMGLSSMLMHLFDVQAKDTMELLWGSPFTLLKEDLLILCILSVLIVFYICFFFRQLSAVFFDAEIATSMQINVKFHTALMVLITALIISTAMKLLGALLIDALLILPALPAMRNSYSLKGTFIRSSVYGTLLSLTGYIAALLLNLPPSGVLSVLSALFFSAEALIRLYTKRRQFKKR